MKLEFPTKFDIEYPENNSLYYTGAGKKIMLKLLLDSCDSYCMYCGKDIKSDNKYEFNMEHSIEKSNDDKDNSFLKNCKYNLSIACPSCNQKYKTRMIDSVEPNLMNVNTKCSKIKCTHPCDEYINVLKDYLSKNKIILQPNNIDGSLINYKIDYNLIKHIFEPSIMCTSQVDRNFISEHIARFHLNRDMYTQSVLNVCEEILRIINSIGSNISISQVYDLIKRDRYENILKKIFIEYLNNIFTDVDSLKQFCELSLILTYI